MKTIVYITYITFIIIFAGCNHNPSPTEQQEHDNNVRANKSVVLKVEGMHCDGCEATIENKIKTIAGVDSVSANYKKGMASIAFDSTLAAETAFVNAIKSTGYKVVENDSTK